MKAFLYSYNNHSYLCRYIVLLLCILYYDVLLLIIIIAQNIELYVFIRNKFHNYTTSNSIYFYVSTTIGGLLQELNVQWSLLARWRG